MMHLKLVIIGTEEEIDVFIDFLKTLRTDKDSVEVAISDKTYPSTRNNRDFKRYADVGFEKDSFK